MWSGAKASSSEPFKTKECTRAWPKATVKSPKRSAIGASTAVSKSASAREWSWPLSAKIACPAEGIPAPSTTSTRLESQTIHQINDWIHWCFRSVRWNTANTRRTTTKLTMQQQWRRQQQPRLWASDWSWTRNPTVNRPSVNIRKCRVSPTETSWKRRWPIRARCLFFLCWPLLAPLGLHLTAATTTKIWWLTLDWLLMMDRCFIWGGDWRARWHPVAIWVCRTNPPSKRWSYAMNSKTSPPWR